MKQMTDPMMTAAEQEVWQVVQAMNRTWTAGRAVELDAFFHPEMIAVTPTDRERLEGRESCMASWQRFTEVAVIRGWQESRPRVRVFGDAAVVSYCYELQCELRGREVTLAGRDLFFMIREGGRWLAVADQFSAFPDAPADPSRSTEALEAIARRWIALWQGGDLEAFDKLHAPDFHDHSPSGRSPDRDGFRQGIVELYRAFPDFHGTIEDLVSDPATGKVTVRWSASGTHRGAFLGRSPTHGIVTFSGIEIIRVEKNRVVERWGEWDGLAIVEQLEAAVS